MASLTIHTNAVQVLNVDPDAPDVLEYSYHVGDSQLLIQL